MPPRASFCRAGTRLYSRARGGWSAGRCAGMTHGGVRWTTWSCSTSVWISGRAGSRTRRCRPRRPACPSGRSRGSSGRSATSRPGTSRCRGSRGSSARTARRRPGPGRARGRSRRWCRRPSAGGVVPPRVGQLVVEADVRADAELVGAGDQVVADLGLASSRSPTSRASARTRTSRGGRARRSRSRGRCWPTRCRRPRRRARGRRSRRAPRAFSWIAMPRPEKPLPTMRTSTVSRSLSLVIPGLPRSTHATYVPVTYTSVT